jgi:hypothetical protein
MVKLQLQWQDGVPAKTLVNEAELDGALQELTSKAKVAGQLFLVGLEAENGNSLSIALGGVETVLIFGRPNTDPPYLTCRGADEALEPVLVCYSLGVHRAEVPRWFVIPLEQGMRGLNEFAATGELPGEGTWVES